MAETLINHGQFKVSLRQRTTREFSDKSSIRHRKKLRSLCLSNDLKPCDPGKVVNNYSSLCISNRTKTLLALE